MCLSVVFSSVTVCTTNVAFFNFINQLIDTQTVRYDLRYTTIFCCRVPMVKIKNHRVFFFAVNTRMSQQEHPNVLFHSYFLFLFISSATIKSRFTLHQEYIFLVVPFNFPYWSNQANLGTSRHPIRLNQ